MNSLVPLLCPTLEINLWAIPNKPERRYMSKYHSVKTEIDGITFDSKREAELYIKLQALERGGAIRALERQVKFPLYGIEANTRTETHICFYVADFVCQDENGQTCIYDAKGMKTAMYRLKKRWFEAQYGLKIIEV